MAATVHPVTYFNARVKDRPGEAYRLLAALASTGVSLLAFNAIPSGGDETQLMLFPADSDLLSAAAAEIGFRLTGPERAFLIQGDDELGALADIHRRLADASVNVFAASGVTDGRGGFGYVIYVRSADFEKAARALRLH